MAFVIVFLLVLLRSIFSLSEMAIVSSKKVRIENEVKKGSRSAQMVLDMINEPERFLSTVQVGITLLGVISNAYGGEALSKQIEPLLIGTSLEIYAPSIAFALVVGLLTYIDIVIGELVPKTIALNNPEGIAMTVAPLMSVLIKITRPIVWLLSVSTRLVLRILFIKPRDESPITEEELKLFIDQGTSHGILEQVENEMIKSIFRFTDRRAYSIMTNRNDLVWLDINDDDKAITDTIIASKFSTYPVCDESLDNVVGIISAKEYLYQRASDAHFNIRQIISKPFYIPENLAGLKILELFKEKRVYVAIVVDEYGVIVGIITLHDLIENIFGDLPDIHDKEEQAIVTREDGSLLVDGSIQIDELKEVVYVNEFDSTDEEYSTLGGFMMFHLNKIPSAGEYFVLEQYRFEIMDMDGNKVDKVLIVKT